ncbi:hypothetical protein [Archangium lipolyticum]|uniref:hypothetical protein n=1 Tax=Archangium lipolyticum TaxID=2970465 RepID=UPI002149DFE9|nr:hypothetical protein [Archangium lipolyticum]
MHTAFLRSALLLLSLSLALSGCGPAHPGLARFSNVSVQLDQRIEGGTLPPVLSVLVSFSRPEGDKEDCALASEDIVATFNGHPMIPVEGVQRPFGVQDFFGMQDNPNCFAPAFRVALSREEALAEGGRATVVVQEGDERVSLVSDHYFNPHGPAGAGPWELQSGQGALIPWSYADDTLSLLRGSSLRNEIRMEPREGALWVMGYRGEYVSRVLIVDGDVGVSVSSCEGIESCAAMVLVHHVINLQIL